MQKPTGKPGANADCILWCIAIERHIQDEAAADILGADLVESGHSRDNGESALLDIAPEDDFGIGGDEEDEEVVAVNAAGTVNTVAPASTSCRKSSGKRTS